MVIYFSTTQFKQIKNVLTRYLQTQKWLSYNKIEMNLRRGWCCEWIGAMTSPTAGFIIRVTGAC